MKSEINLCVEHLLVSIKKEQRPMLIHLMAIIELKGAIKIFKMIPHIPKQKNLSLHLEEEVRHAFTLLHWSNCNNRAQINFSSCYHLKDLYIQILDQEIAAKIQIKRQLPNYLLTSFLIEMRAVAFYQDLLSNWKDEEVLQRVITSILIDERHHLEEARREIKNIFSDSDLQDLTNKENEIFLYFVIKLCHFFKIPFIYQSPLGRRDLEEHL